jgi:hypothetical protein
LLLVEQVWPVGQSALVVHETPHILLVFWQVWPVGQSVSFWQETKPGIWTTKSRSE